MASKRKPPMPPEAPDKPVMRQTVVRLPEDLLARLDDVATKTESSRNGLIVEAVRQVLDTDPLGPWSARARDQRRKPGPPAP